MTTPALPQPGDLIADKYRVERILGEGAMGVVVAARHIELDEIRAVKLMLPSALGDGGAERFLREARAAVRLKSPHVCRVIDTGRREDGLPYIIMEHLEGTDFKRVLDTRGALPPEEAVTYILQACDALAEAHALGIVHRDLKPANLFLARGPKGEPFLKVLDFGIAKVGPATDARAFEITKTADIIGTPLFMSPEQMRSTRDVDARTDIWGLGIILYRALTGKVPFHGTTITQLCAAVMTDTPVSPSALVPGLPAGLDAIVLRCLEKQPEKRFAHAAELSLALGPYVRPALPSFPAVLAGTGPIVSAPVLESTGISGQTTRRASTFERGSQGPEARASTQGALLGGAVLAFVLVLAIGGWMTLRREAPAEVAAAGGVGATAAATVEKAVTAVVPPAPVPSASAAETPAQAAPSASATVRASASALAPAPPRKVQPSPPRDAFGSRK